VSAKQDAFRRLTDDLAANRISRRDFMRRSAALGLSAQMMVSLLAITGASLALATRPARAASSDNKIVVASWGGSFGDAQRKAHFEPFTKATGIEVVLAPQQPEPALLQAQVQSGKVEWDLAEVSLVGAGLLANKGVLEKIDYSAMNAETLKAVNPVVLSEHGVGIFYWPWVLGYNTTSFGPDNHPRNWADFWDVQKYPGPRGMTTMDYEPPPLEIPYLANGVTPDKLYPMDIEQGFKYLTAFRDKVVAWTGYDKNPATLLAQGEIVAVPSSSGTLYNTKKQGGAIEWVWDQGLLYYDAWVMPKGAPHQQNAIRFIEFTLQPQVQAAMTEGYPSAPVVASANDLLPPEIKKVSLSDPETVKRMVTPNVKWWTDLDANGKSNIDRVYEKWATWKL
jgi:putative spermidine/putrescine transport system substrate-binding protein